MAKGQSPVPGAEIQEQIKLDISVSNVTDTPYLNAKPAM